MPRIIKATNVNIDEENIFNVTTIQHQPVQVMPVAVVADGEAAERAIKLMLEDARQEAENIKSKAKQEAESIVSTAKDSAKTEAEAIKEAAKKQGYDDGYAKGEKQAQKLINDANETLSKAKAESLKIIADIEPDTVDTIIKICEKIIGNSLSLNPEVIMYLVKEGIHRTSKAGYINIHVCPDDYDVVVENKITIMSYVGGSTQIEIINDYSLSRGACLIETPLGNVDSSLDLQLKQLLIDIRIMFNNRLT